MTSKYTHRILGFADILLITFVMRDPTGQKVLEE